MLVREKTHLIQVGEEYNFKVKWHRRVIDLSVKLTNGMPSFVIISNYGRVEFQTRNLNEVEEQAKFFCYPRGRRAIESDKAYIYIETMGAEKETLLGTVFCMREREFRPMYDLIEKGE